MKAEGEGRNVKWYSSGGSGIHPKGLCSVVRSPPRGPSDRAETPLAADFFTFNRSSTVIAHRLLPSRENTEELESCKLTIAAASAAECGVTALASAEAETNEAPLQLLAGLSNGQLWLLEVKEQEQREIGGQKLPRSLTGSSKQLLCCRMAEPIDIACCYVTSKDDTGLADADKSKEGLSKWILMVVVLYSDGVAVASWPDRNQTTEFPVVDGGCRLTLSPRGDHATISTRKRRLVLLKRDGWQFSVLKDFSPLKLTGPAEPPPQPAWVKEEKLLLPGALQLRCSSRSSAWEEATEAPSLPQTEAAFPLAFVQHFGFIADGRVSVVPNEGEGEPLICGVSTRGTICVWRMQEEKPLMTIRNEGKAQLQGICLLPAVAPLACLMLLRSDGTLGFLCLSSEDLCSAARSAAQAAVASPTVDKRTSQNSKTPLADGEEVEGAKSSKASASSVEAFLSREAAEASAEESENETEGNELFDGMEAEERTPPKKHSRKRRKRSLAGAEEESESSGTETGGFHRTSVDGEGLDAGDAETVASSIIALRSELREAQAMINSLFKRQHYIKQPIVHPGGGPKPLEAGKPWCLFWTHIGHITKTVTADNSVLDVFNFSPGAVADGTAHRKLTDLQNSSAAALCRAGVVLAASGSNHSVLEFRSFLDAGSWLKHFPEGEEIVAVAAGDSFVAAVTEERTLRIFTLGGTLLYTADVFGKPVSLCGSQQLLIVVTQTGSSEGFLQLYCYVLHVHPSPACENATFRLPISCLKRRLAAPPAAAACIPEVDIIHEGFFDVGSPLDWISVSPGGMPAVKDTSGIVRGLLPVASTSVGGLSYAFRWVKLCSLREASATAPLFPIIIDETKGELGVVRLKANEEGLSFPDCSVADAFFGYTMEHIPLRIPSPDLWKYGRWQRLLRQDKQLKGVGDGGGDAALVPWPQYDELRFQQEMAIRQLNHFVSICGGSTVGGAEGDAEAREAHRKLQLLSKRHDKYCLRGFAKCTDDKRLHGVAKEMALRLKNENAPQHARSLLDSDTRLQAEQLREALLWQEQQRHSFGAIATAAAETNAVQKENCSPPQDSFKQTEQKSSTSGEACSTLPTEKRSSIQKLIQWQQLQQQQQQRRGGDVGLAMLFDGQKRRASESGLDRAQKKSYFHKAD